MHISKIYLFISLILNIHQKYLIMVLYAEDIMRKNIRIFDENLSASEGARIMASNHTGFIIVGKNNVPEGIVTEWDYVNKVVAKDLDPKDIKLKSIMETPLTYVSPDTPMEKIAKIMSEHSIRRLPVIDVNKLAGVITSRDVIKFFNEYVTTMVDIASKFGIR